MTIDLKFSDSFAHPVALYLVDWDAYGGGRSETIDVLDANGTVLDSRPVTSFGGGEYLVWSMSGHVIIRIQNTNSRSNATISGIFFP